MSKHTVISCRPCDRKSTLYKTELMLLKEKKKTHECKGSRMKLRYTYLEFQSNEVHPFMQTLHKQELHHGSYKDTNLDD